MKQIKKLKSLMSWQLIVPVMLLLIFLVIVGVTSQKSPVFEQLEVREEANFSIQVPTDWQRQEDGDLVYFYDTPDIEQASSVIMVSVIDEAFSEFDSYSDEQKDQIISSLQSSFNQNFSSEESETGLFGFDVVEAEPTEHQLADRATRLKLTSDNSTSTSFVGEGRLMVTAEGSVIFIVIGVHQGVYESESAEINSIIEAVEVS